MEAPLVESAASASSGGAAGRVDRRGTPSGVLRL